jgi:hypothetical protein
MIDEERVVGRTTEQNDIANLPAAESSAVLVF